MIANNIAGNKDRPGLVQICWRRKSLVALCLTIGAVCGGLFYLQSPPTYQAEAKVLVVKKNPEAVTGESASAQGVEDFVDTHRILIQSPLIVDRAIHAWKLQNLRTFADPPEDLTEAIIKKLSVNRASPEAMGSPNGVISISYRGPDAEDCGAIVNAVLDSYRTFLDESCRDNNGDTYKLLTEAREVLFNDWEKQKAEHRAFREHAPMLWSGKEEINPLQERLAQIETRRSALLLRKADLEGQVETLEKARKSGKSYDELLGLIFAMAYKEESVASDRAVPVNFKTEMLPLLLEDRTLSAEYGPNHPQVQAVRQRMDAMRNFFVLPSSVSVPQSKMTEAGGAVQTPEPVAAYSNYLREQMDHVAIDQDALAKLYQETYDAARKLNSYQTRDADFDSSIASTKLLYDGLVKRLQDTGMIERLGSYNARVIAPAGRGKKVFPNLLLVSAASLFLSLLAGFGLAFLAEAADKRFRNLEDVRHQLLLPVMACIPAVPRGMTAQIRRSKRGAFSPMLVSFYQPRSIVAESYRAIRTSLFFSEGSEAHKVIQFTSSTAGEGKSVVAANVAVSIAQSGKRTLLIDADLRKPRLHEIFALSAEVGLAAVIDGEAEYADAIEELEIPNLSVLPCGPVPADPAELLSSPRFAELLRLFREQYDYVVLDSSPVLAVTDATVVAHHVDGVLLVVRTSKAGRPMAERTRDVLHTLGARILGVVVNAVERSGASSFAYGSAYGYPSVPANEPPKLTATATNNSHPRELAPGA